jgi:hypothetical protein
MIKIRSQRAVNVLIVTFVNRDTTTYRQTMISLPAARSYFTLGDCNFCEYLFIGKKRKRKYSKNMQSPPPPQ